MRAVNLLPRDLEREGSAGGRTPLFVIVGGLAIVTAAAAVLVMGSSGDISEQRSQLESVEAAIALTPSNGAPVVSSAVVQERTDRVAALAAAVSTRVRFDRLLRDLAYVIPGDAWLTGLRAEAPVSATPGTPAAAGTPSTAPSGVTITGATYSQATVARLLARLSALPSLDRVQLTETSRNDPQADEAAPASKRRRAVVTFSISASLVAGSRP